MKNILNIALSCVAIFILSNAQAQPVFTTTITQNTLAQQTNPGDFTTLFYGLVLAHEIANSTYEKNLATLFFTPDLLNKFNHQKADCIDFRIFTGAQDNYQGFWLGKIKENNNEILQPVYLQMDSSSLKQDKPSVMLQLVKTEQGFKIKNIIYPQVNTNLNKEFQACAGH